jgi:hypothetical protein
MYDSNGNAGQNLAGEGGFGKRRNAYRTECTARVKLNVYRCRSGQLN